MGRLYCRALLALSILAGAVSGQDAGILSPGSSIQDRIDRLPAVGGALELGPGVHEIGQAIRLRDGLTLRGAGTNTVLRAMAGRSIPLLATGDFTAGVSNVQVLSLALDGNGRAQSYTANDWGKRWSATNLASIDNVGIYLKRARGIVLSNVRFDDFLNEGIMAVACSNLALLDCRFTNCCQEGSPRNDFAQGAVYLRATTDSRFIRSRLFGCFEGGIKAYQSDSLRIFSNTLRDTAFGAAIVLHGTKDVVVQGNRFSGNPEDLQRIGEVDGRIE
jgi:hypothetical protein